MPRQYTHWFKKIAVFSFTLLLLSGGIIGNPSKADALSFQKSTGVATPALSYFGSSALCAQYDPSSPACNTTTTSNSSTSTSSGNTTTTSNSSTSSNNSSSSSQTPSTTDSLSCTSNGPMNWILCPVINLFSQGAQWFDTAINSELNINTDTYFSQSKNSKGTGTAYYDTWSAFRYIALSALVIIGLFMVLSQAFGIGIFEAYTVKKLLPKIAASIIIISFSWQLSIYIIQVVDAIGSGVRILIYYPFIQAGLDPSHIHIWTGLGLVATGAALGTLVLAPAVLLLLALSAFFAALTAVVVIIMRQIILLFLVVIAPVALVANILPGTQKLWSMWWSNFIKLLLMYPLIVAFIAAGHVFAATVAGNTNGSTGTKLLYQLVEFVAYFGPYFALPAVFKMSGSIMSFASGAIMNAGRATTYGRLNKRSAEMTAQRYGKWKTGQLYNDRNRFTRSVNSLGRRIGVGAGGRFGYGSRGRAALESAATMHSAEIEKTNPTFAAFKEDDKVMTLLALNENRAEAEEWIRKKASAKAAADAKRDTELEIQRQQAAGNTMSQEQINSFRARREAAVRTNQEQIYGQALNIASRVGFNENTRRSALMTGSAIGYGLSSGEDGWKEATAAMASISGLRVDKNGNFDTTLARNNQAYRDMMNRFQYVAKGVGRADLSGNTDGNSQYDGERAWNSVSLYQHANSKPADLKGAEKTYHRLIREAIAGTSKDAQGNEITLTATERKENLIKAAVFANEQGQLAMNATGAVRDAAIKAQQNLHNFTYQDPTGKDVTIDITDAAEISRLFQAGPPSQQAVQDLRNDINNRSRTYRNPSTPEIMGQNFQNQQNQQQ